MNENTTKGTYMNHQQRSATTGQRYNPCKGLDGNYCKNTAIRALLLPGEADWTWLCEDCAYIAEERAAQQQAAYLARRRQEVAA